MTPYEDIDPFEAAHRIREMKDTEALSGKFDYQLYGFYKNCMRSPKSVFIAEREIMARNAADAFEWYFGYLCLGFYFQDETYNLMRRRIIDEYDFEDLKATDLNNFLIKLNNSRLYLGESKNNEVYDSLYKKQYQEFISQLTDLTPKMAAKRINVLSKDNALLDPKFLELKVALEAVNTDYEMKELAKLQSRATKAKDKPEKLAEIEFEIKKNRNNLNIAILNAINKIFN